MLTLWDTFAAGTAILFVVFWQAVAVGWVYGKRSPVLTHTMVLILRLYNIFVVVNRNVLCT